MEHGISQISYVTTAGLYSGRRESGSTKISVLNEEYTFLGGVPEEFVAGKRYSIDESMLHELPRHDPPQRGDVLLGRQGSAPARVLPGVFLSSICSDN